MLRSIWVVCRKPYRSNREPYQSDTELFLRNNHVYMKKILFVCLGNICRSSTAEGVMLHLIEEAGLEKEFVIDSAGILSYHRGIAG